MTVIASTALRNKHDGLNVAVIGTGLIGPRHAATVIDEQNTTLCAVVDPAPNSRGFAASVAVPHFDSISDLLKSACKPDAAIVCTPNHTHVPVGIELVKAGIHVLVEKPISADTDSGRSLIREATAANVVLAAGHHRRFNPFVAAAKRALQNSELGTIVGVSGLWMSYKPIEYFTSAPWRQTRQGGVLLINMIHEIDILQYLLGPISRVYAEKSLSFRGFDAEEGAAITLRFKSGCIGTFLISDHAPSQHNFESGTGENPLIPVSGSDFLRIFGTEGCLSVPDLGIAQYAAEIDKSWHNRLETIHLDVRSDEIPFKLQLMNFVDAIHRRNSLVCKGEDGLSALIVCEALKQSLATQQPVVIDQ